MATLFIRHRVKNYADWKKVFDNFAPARRAGGEISYIVGHVAGKPNNLCLTFRWDTASNASKFLKSKELRAAMKDAGVSEKPQILIIEEKVQGKT